MPQHATKLCRAFVAPPVRPSAIRRSAIANLRAIAPAVFALGAAALALGGCGSGGSESKSGALSGDADFSACLNTPAADFHAGLVLPSTSGAYAVTIEAAVSMEDPGNIVVDEPAIGSTTLTISVAAASPTSGTADGAAPADAGLPVGSDFSVTDTALPWMPEHRHGASSLPVVASTGAGTYAVSKIYFFMGGYWQVSLNLIPTAGAPDTVVLPVCVPDN